MVIDGRTLPDPGEGARLEGQFYQQDPKTGMGLDFEEVQIDTPLGPTPAWYVPGTSDTWAIFIHGRAMTPAEGLRALGTTHALGYPTLLITYRNDDGAPAATGYPQFGKDEWEDLQSAARYALDNGAQDLVLIGNSMGGSISASFLLNSPDADLVRAVFWDSPALDAERLFDPFYPAGMWAMVRPLMSWRYGIDWVQVDYVARADQFDVPILIAHSTADPVVPIDISRDFAAAADPALVRLEEFEGADHTGLWNSERERYETLMREFFEENAQG